MKTLRSLIWIITGIFAISCSSDSSDSPGSEPSINNTTSNLVSMGYVIDYDNNGNAGDLVVSYSVNNSSNLTALWLFIAPESKFSSINSKVLGELASNRYQKINISTSKTEIRPSAQLLDTDGNPIGPGTAYKLGFATVKGNIISKDVANSSFDLKDQHYLTGKYTGFWNDSMFTNYQISIEITTSSSGMRGPVYLNHNFQAHHGGNDDGRITFQVNGESLENIVWMEDLTDYMGGCSGEWTGTGSIIDITTLSMTLSGENCFYSAQNAAIELKRAF